MTFEISSHTMNKTDNVFQNWMSMFVSRFPSKCFPFMIHCFLSKVHICDCARCTVIVGVDMFLFRVFMILQKQFAYSIMCNSSEAPNRNSVLIFVAGNSQVSINNFSRCLFFLRSRICGRSVTEKRDLQTIAADIGGNIPNAKVHIETLSNLYRFHLMDSIVKRNKSRQLGKKNEFVCAPT